MAVEKIWSFQINTQGRRISLEAPAKINIYLKVTGRRPDGYHELDSVMARLTLADCLTFDLPDEPGHDILESSTSLTGGLPPDFNDSGNLILKAVDNYRSHSNGWPLSGVRVTVEKNIPLGAGLGGGSADCAAALTALNHACPSPLPADALREMARGLGADVPFFLRDGSVLRARGIGEVLFAPPEEYADWSGRPLILINPGVEVNTGKVFATLGLTNPPPDNNLGPVMIPVPGENDLFSPALKVAPVLKEVAAVIKNLNPIHWGLSGSGATFWLYSAAPDRDLDKLQANCPKWWVKKTMIA